MRPLISTLFLVLSLSSLCPAQEAGQTRADSGESRYEIEDWYLHIALGYGKPFYPSPLRETISAMDANPYASRVNLSIEVIGLYRPLNHHTMVGGSLNSVVDHFNISGEATQFFQHLLSASVMHFPLNEIGEGLFLRGDLGVAWLLRNEVFGESDWGVPGIGALMGGGYAIPVSAGARITLNANYSSKWIDGEWYGAISVNAGILF